MTNPTTMTPMLKSTNIGKGEKDGNYILYSFATLIGRKLGKLLYNLYRFIDKL